MSTIEKGESVRSVGRALEILQAFTAQDIELSAAELLKRVKLSRSTLYRLLYSLEEHGFIVSAGEPQVFRLGPSVARLARAWMSSLDLSAVADPILRRIWQATGETVALFVHQGSMRLCVAEIASTQPLSFKRGVGYTEHVTRGATGRVILANADVEPEVWRVWAMEASVDPDMLAKALQKTRVSGYATSRNELIQGAVAIAAPFFNFSGNVAGSIGVFGPETRMNAQRQEEIAKLLMREAGALSTALGHVKTGSAA